MTQPELFNQLAQGNYHVTSSRPLWNATSLTGRIMNIYFIGHYINVSVAFEGIKWDLVYFENTSVKTDHYLNELETHIL